MAAPQKTVLITGCTPGGIGHALAVTLSRPPYSYHVFATARTPDSLSALAQLPNITPLELDVTDAASIAQLRDTVAAATSGRLDYLVNNAGRGYPVPALDVDLAEARQVFDTNVLAVMQLCAALAPLLIAAARAAPAPPLSTRVLAALGLAALPPRPAIIQVGSIAATMPFVFGSVYNASKAALHAYSATLKVELAPFGVDVVTLVTGGVKSNIARVERRLRDESVYKPLEKEYQARLVYSQTVGMETAVYAQRVAARFTGTGRREWIWEGAAARLTWFVVTCLPRSVMHWWMTREFGLARLAGLERRKAR